MNDIDFGEYVEDILTRMMNGDDDYRSMIPFIIHLVRSRKKGRLILSSGAKYNQINFSKNHVSGNARKIEITVIWWFTALYEAEKSNEN